MKRPALFLDRDGVINVDKNYVHKREDFVFIDGIFDLVKRANSSRYHVIIITNQAGIGRGFYTENDFHSLMSWVTKKFEEKGAYIDAVYFSPFHPIHGLGKYKKDSDCRKPKPGMLLQAATDFDIDLERSILIGDKQTDIEAGISARVRNNVLFDTRLCSFNDIIF